MPISFRSPSAAAATDLGRVLVQQEIARRQAALERLALAERQQEAERQAKADANAEADRLAWIYGPDANLTPEVASALKAGGYAVDQPQPAAPDTGPAMAVGDLYHPLANTPRGDRIGLPTCGDRPRHWHAACGNLR